MTADALLLAGYGWQVFALSPSGYPYAICDRCQDECAGPSDYAQCGCLLCHAFYRGTTAPERLTRMWERRPASIIGIRTGAASGLVVLDFDRHPGGADGLSVLRELKASGELPQTVTARTGGGGYHLYFQHPDLAAVPTRPGWRPGVDVKSDGGYVVAAPSAKTGRPAYGWYPGRAPWEHPLAELPATLLGTVVRTESKWVRRSAATAPAGADGGGVGTVADDDGIEIDLRPMALHDFQRALDHLEWATNGTRNTTLYRAACRAGDAVGAGAITLDAARGMLMEAGLSVGLSRSTVAGTIRSGITCGLSDSD